MSDATDTQRLLGKFSAQIEALTKAVEAMSVASDASRSKMYDRINSVDNKVTTIVNAVDDLDLRIGKVEPVIADVSKWRERAIGARMTITLFIASLGGSIALGLQWIWTHLSGKTA